MELADLAAALSPLRLLVRLIEAAARAEALNLERTQFAITIADLHICGVTTDDLRFLKGRGWVVAHCGRRRGTSKKRSLLERPDAIGAFVISDAGIRAACDIRAALLADDGSATTERANQPIPNWDDQAGNLFFRGALVKHLSRRAVLQRFVLNVEQECGWPRRLDDPLPPRQSTVPKCRLNNLIKKLNAHRINPLIRFEGDGTGEGICWRPVDERHQPSTNTAPHGRRRRDSKC